jgi:hypothetical protein
MNKEVMKMVDEYVAQLAGLTPEELQLVKDFVALLENQRSGGRSPDPPEAVAPAE